MRLAFVTSFVLFLWTASSAPAALCPDCKGGGYTKDIGRCTHCGDGMTTSGQHKLCMGCSVALQQCEHCQKPLKAAATQPTTRPIDRTADGQYKEGAWEYRYTVSNKGTRSEGYHGELLYGGKPLAEPPTINDYYLTPWGKLYWVGKPAVLFGGHGWMLSPKVSAKPGSELPAPVAGK